MADWPHAPVHRLDAAGAYMVTVGTYQKTHLFKSDERRTMLRDQLFALAGQYSWRLQAWAILSNHYHFVALSPDDNAQSLRRTTGHLHTTTAKEINRLDHEPRRKVWHQYWETELTYEASYFARLRYVHQNPVHHGLVAEARAYEVVFGALARRAGERGVCENGQFV